MDALSRTKHWALGAVIAALCSFVYAKAPGMPHVGGGYAGVAAHRAVPGEMRNTAHYYGTPGVPPHNAMVDRDMRAPRGAMKFAGQPYVSGFGGYNPGMRRVAGLGGYSGDGRGGMQYAGAITPVSAESHAVPRPPANAPVRAGSIRADVARYNEERGSPRGMQRQTDDPRQPEGSPYRN